MTVVEKKYLQKPYRRSNRMIGYDYALEGVYFITIATRQRFYMFGDVVNGKMILNQCGWIAYEQWMSLGNRFKPCDFSAFVIMPYHIHRVIRIVRGAGEKFEHGSPGIPPLRPYFERGVLPVSLGIIVRSYKASVTYRVNTMRGHTQPPVCQRNYYDHVIRNDQEYEDILNYINANPGNWLDDQ